MNFMIYCIDDPAKGQADETLRNVHRKYLFETFKEQLLAGGPTFEADGKTINGRVMLAEFPTQADCEAFMRDEPYNKAGQVKSVEIKPMRMAIFKK
jgi:uncharacterized protein YciI